MPKKRLTFDFASHLDWHYYNCTNECAYYLEDDVKVEFGKAKEIYDIWIVDLNCRSLVKLFYDLKYFLINVNSNNKVDIIALCCHICQ